MSNTNNNKKLNFYVIDSGDHSVGLNGFEVTIQVTDESGVLDDLQDEFAEFMKEKMKEYFSEMAEGRIAVYTEHEIDSYDGEPVYEND